MTEKELPFKLPLNPQRPAVGTTLWSVIDANGIEVARVYTKEQAGFIYLACNSYFEQKKALERINANVISIPLRHALGQETPLQILEQIKKSVQKDTEAALKGDTNESD